MEPEFIALAILLPMLLSLTATPAVMRLATAIGAIDKPDDRKVHKGAIPRLGGTAIALAFAATIATAVLAFPGLSLPQDKNWILIGVALVFITGVGVWDDLRSMSARNKFLAQVAAASVVYAAGVSMSIVDFPVIGIDRFPLGVFSFPATILWIVGITNAINLIDGLDGLASGISVVALVTIYAVSAQAGNQVAALAALALAGAVAGFLRYNFYPARVFLGDSGSLFLGFGLSILALISWSEGAKGFALVMPSVVLALPIADTALSVIRRYLRSHLKGEPSRPAAAQGIRSLFVPDRSHIHHRLMALGLSHRDAVLLLYGVSSVLGISAYLMHRNRDSFGTLILMLVVIAILIGIHNLRYHEIPVHRNGIMIKFYNRFYRLPYTRRTAFQVAIDSVFVLLSFGGSAQLLNAADFPGSEKLTADWLLPAVVTIQIVSFWFTGLYKETTKLMGVGDALRILRSVSGGTIASAFVVALLFTVDTAVPYFVLGFFFLLSFVGVSRFSYTFLSYWLHRDSEGKKRTLIFGANTRGLTLLQTILNEDGLDIAPVGFLDSDPQLEDKRINGFPIYGSHWGLEETLLGLKIQCLIVVDLALSPEEQERIDRSCARAGVEVRHFRLALDPITKPEAAAKRFVAFDAEGENRS